MKPTGTSATVALLRLKRKRDEDLHANFWPLRRFGQTCRLSDGDLF